ncbi:MAG: DUF6148 family protein [Synergistaceae bacterium]|jgi:hypothetical protein
MDERTRLEKLRSAQDMYARYLEAERSVLLGQSYSIGDRTLTRANLSDIAAQREYWAAQVTALAENKTGVRFLRVVPRDI